MNGKRPVSGVALYQRVLQNFPDDPVNGGYIFRKGLEDAAKRFCPSRKELFWNGVGVEKCAGAQEVSCCRVGLLDALKGEGPGGGHRVRVIEIGSAAITQ